MFPQEIGDYSKITQRKRYLNGFSNVKPSQNPSSKVTLFLNIPLVLTLPTTSTWLDFNDLYNDYVNEIFPYFSYSQKSLEILGLTQDEILSIFKIIAVVLKLGNLLFIPITNIDGTEGCEISNEYGEFISSFHFIYLFSPAPLHLRKKKAEK